MIRSKRKQVSRPRRRPLETATAAGLEVLLPGLLLFPSQLGLLTHRLADVMHLHLHGAEHDRNIHDFFLLFSPPLTAREAG